MTRQSPDTSVSEPLKPSTRSASASCRLVPRAHGRSSVTRRRVSQRHRTYNVGRTNEFTAIRDVSFFVEDSRQRGIHLDPRAQWVRQEHNLTADRRSHAAASGDGRRSARIEPSRRWPGGDRGMVFQDYTSFDNPHRTGEHHLRAGMPRRNLVQNDSTWDASGSAA